FDLVYGVNVLHVAKDLLFSLAQARDALAPGGCLVISECVRPYLNQPMYPELVFQILDSFTDVDIDPEFRPNPGFLTADHWRRAFNRAGFEHTEVKPELDVFAKSIPISSLARFADKGKRSGTRSGALQIAVLRNPTARRRRPNTDSPRVSVLFCHSERSRGISNFLTEK